MERLSDKQFWNQVHTSHAPSPADAPRPTFKQKLIRRVKSRLGSSIESYSAHLLWNTLFKRHLSPVTGQTMLEVGSAPGESLIQFRDTFGYEPYGVEYAEAGVEQNRLTFRAAGANPDHVIHSDFFSAEFQTKYANHFDLVYSGGFIEHFTNVQEVIDNHLALLKPGGRLVITIPRLKGLNYPLIKFLNADNLAIHNLDIMEVKPFTALFSDEKLQHLYCDYTGTFSLNLVEPKQWHGFKYRIIRLMWLAQLPINALLRVLFGDQGKESYLFSPYLAYIGIKK